MEYGILIKAERERWGIKQKDLADRLGWQSSQLSSRETGTVTMTQAEYMGAQSAIATILREREAGGITEPATS